MKAAGGISAERMADLERRVQVLEERTRRAIWGGNTEALRREETMVERYGESVDKTVAARLLGVTRATVYAMLADGRICGACAGRRVDMRSIARYLSQRTPVQGCAAKGSGPMKRIQEENDDEHDGNGGSSGLWPADWPAGDGVCGAGDVDAGQRAGAYARQGVMQA